MDDVIIAAEFRFLLGDSRRLLDVDTGVEALLGFTRDDFLAGRATLEGRIHADDRELADSLFARGEDNDSGSLNLRLRRANGKIRCCRALFTKSPATPGPGTLLTLVVQDAKSLYRAAPEAAGMAGFRSLLELTDDLFYFRDCNHVYIGASPSSAREAVASGLQVDLAGLTDYDLLPEIHADRGYQLAQQVLDGAPSATSTGEHITKDGKKGWAEFRAYPLHAPRGELCGVVIVVRKITGFMQSQQALQESEALFRAMFENSLSMMVLVEPDSGALIDANPAAAAFYGYSVAQMRTMHLSQINTLPPERMAAEMAVAKGKKQNYFVFTHRLASGELRTVEVRTSPIPVGGRTLMFGIVNDISDLKRSEQELDATLNSIADGFCSCDEKWRIVYFNHQAGAMLGLRSEDVLGKRLWEAFPGTLSPEMKACFLDAIAGKTRETEVFYEVTQRWYHARLYPRPGGGVSFYYLDISERKAQEEALRQAHERLALAQSAAHAGTWEWDLATDTLTWSPEALAMHGIASDTGHVPLATWHQSLHPDDLERTRAMLDQRIANHQPLDDEFRIVLPSGEIRWIEGHGRAQYDHLGQPQRVHGLCLDITERKRTEAALAQAMADSQAAIRAKEAFLANVSHEMRTPLNVIVGIAELLRRDIGDRDAAAKLEQLTDSAQHLLGIIGNILDFSSAQAGRFALDSRDFQLASAMRRTQGMLAERARAKGLTLAVDIPPALANIHLRGDAQRLTQVLVNLCDNAIKFTEEGWVRLAVAELGADGDTITLGFSVADSGIGIAASEQGKLFTPFTQVDASSTRNQGGTGLGLAISQRLVALMGGQIRIDSQPGHGSRFSFKITLPRGHQAPEAMPAAGTDCGHYQILLVEDHTLSRQILAELLAQLGCTVTTAEDGATAVALAGTQVFDLILMDWQMPVLDGLDATRAIRALPGHSGVPIIALTANSLPEDRDRCLAAGMDHHIGKPATLEVLASTLRQWLPALPLAGALADDDSPLPQLAGVEIAKFWRSSSRQFDNYRGLLARFIASDGQELATIRTHLAAGDREAAAVLAHKLKGGAGFLGAHTIADCAANIEKCLTNGADTATIHQLISTIEGEMARLEEALRAQ